MKQQQLNSILDLIDSKRDAFKAAKSPCFPLPYTLLTIERPIAGNKRGIIPCVELKNLNGGYELRRCDEIVSPIKGESINDYLKRLEAELCRKDILGETIL